MKKSHFFIILSLITFLAIFSFMPNSVLADGMIIKPDPYSNRWDYSNENNQQAFINYDNGMQKMIISVGLEGENSAGVVWLFPVPADPNKVAIDIVKSLPQLSGEEISQKAKSNLDEIIKILPITQLYTIPFLSFQARGLIYTSRDKTFGAVSTGLGGVQDVVVYEHLDKEGISSEIITAKTADGLYNYLKNKGLKIESGSIPVLDNYIGKEYSFIASWINAPEKNIPTQNMKGSYGLYNSSNQKGVFVTFPTKDLYFPLLPTSVYGSKTVPATIRVIGHVSPKIFQDIKSYTKTNYYVDNYAIFAEDLKNFYSKQNKNVKYTKIEINAPSKFLTDDLWINKHTPIKTYFSTFIAKHQLANTIILLVLSSIIAGILAGLLIFKDLRKKPLKLGLIGLANCLTIFALIITTVLVGTKNKNKNIDSLLAEIKQKGYFWKRRVATILFFIAIPFLVLGLFALPEIINRLSHYSTRYFMKNSAPPILILYILPLIALLIGFVIKSIKTEDKNLFKQLKLANYSSWSFQPKDKMKIAFVPIFSISFLVISWLLFELIKFIV